MMGIETQAVITDQTRTATLIRDVEEMLDTLSKLGV